MELKDKLKIGFGLAASIGAGALASSVLTPMVNNIKGGKIMKICAVFGAAALVGATGYVASDQMEKTVDTLYEIPGLVKELGQK